MSEGTWGLEYLASHLVYQAGPLLRKNAAQCCSECDKKVIQTNLLSIAGVFDV